jgi:hemolysin activation/secretion protein
MRNPPAPVVAGLLAALLAGGAARAQTAPNIGDALRQSQPPQLPARPAPAPALPGIGGASDLIEAPMVETAGAPRIAVQRLQIVGNRVIDTATLAALVADGAGKTLGLAELEALAQRITRHYRARGYFVARAYIPAQDVTDGTVRIRVVEGNYGEFRLANKSLVRDATVQAMLDDVKKYDIVSVDTLERAMLIINDTPGVQVTRADVLPGQRVGTSDFAVDTAATPAYDGFVALDNYGSAYTGKDRLSFNVDANSPTGRGDRLTLGGLGTDGGGLRNARLAYSALLAPDGWRGELAVARTQYQLGEAFSPLDAVGTAKAVDASFSYPLRRTRSQTIELDFSFDYKDLLDEVRATGTESPRTTKAITAGASLRDENAWLGEDGLTQASVVLTFGDLSIGNAAALAADQAGARAAGDYSKLVATAGRTSVLPAGFTTTGLLRWQQTLNHKNLDGSEQMAVSGPGAVVAYAPEELIGDNARFLHLELGHPLPAIGNLQDACQVFVDVGAAGEAQAFTGNPERHLSDLGIGFTAGNAKGPVLQAALARRLPSAAPLSESEPRTRFLLQAGWSF